MSENSCDSCSNYIYDEEFEEYVCDVSMDEDDMCRFMTSPHYQCPYYSLNDEYKIVRKQM